MFFFFFFFFWAATRLILQYTEIWDQKYDLCSLLA